ncbi:MAG: DUF5343 domain-containing protein [Actinobacteria bacterium]|nr:DUF5343 domain-containing protein [Actinomycetota bacterium]MCL5887429.1 DUF5343 domain-containing protein [Actinomycetota bacterium]
MANQYPYVPSAGPLLKTIEHLRRRSFPKEVTADTLRKLGVAPKNESYVINVLHFLGVIDDAGVKVDAKTAAFVQHKEDEFQRTFESLVKDAYEELFELHGDGAWDMDRASLTQFFRTADHSSEVVGTRQAATFSALANLSGHGTAPVQRETTPRPSAPKKAKTTKMSSAGAPQDQKGKGATTTTVNENLESRVGLTVRIEVNLPADGDQQTYDRIFRSIRKNLIDGE